jgi:hypothetical protein
MFKFIHSFWKEFEPYFTMFSLLGMTSGGVLGYFSPIVNILGLPLSIILGSCLCLWCIQLLQKVIKKTNNILMRDNVYEINQQSTSQYYETWIDIELTNKRVSHSADANIHNARQLGAYMIYLVDKNKKNPDIQAESLLIFKNEINIQDYKIDIIKLRGKIDDPYAVFAYPYRESYNGLCQGVIIRIGNVDIENSKYKINFIRK